MQVHKQASKQASKQELSLLRIIATVAVIFLHTNNALSDNAAAYNLTKVQHIFFSTMSHVMNWAVPIFLMITGILFLDSTKYILPEVCIRKYAKRILLALIVFGVPFSMMELLMAGQDFSAFMIGQSILAVFKGESWGHLWYLYTLIGIYLILPILKAFISRGDRKEQRYVLIILFIFNFCFPMVYKMTGNSSGFYLPLTSFPVFYVLLGKYMEDRQSGYLINRKTDALLIVLLIALIVIVSAVSYPSGEDYLGYNSPIIAGLAMVIYTTVKNHPPLKSGIRINLWKIDRICFGAYLIHPLFINFIYKYIRLTPVSFKWYPLMILLFWITFIIFAFAGSYMMNLVKPLKKYVL